MSRGKFLTGYDDQPLSSTGADTVESVVLRSKPGVCIYQYIGTVEKRTVPRVLKVGDVAKNNRGEDVRIIDVSFRGGSYSVVGVCVNKGPGEEEETVLTYTESGKFYRDGRDCDFDLVMPEGTETRKVLVPPEGSDDE